MGTLNNHLIATKEQKWQQALGIMRISALSDQQIVDVVQEIRGRKVILEQDLAKVFGIRTTRLQELFAKNKSLFPEGSFFQLDSREWSTYFAAGNHLWKTGFTTERPYAFTNEGVVIMASALSSSAARSFAWIRELMAQHADMSVELCRLEQRYNRELVKVFGILRESMEEEYIEMEVLQRNRA